MTDRGKMLIDFQQHYTPAELLKGDPGKLTAIATAIRIICSTRCSPIFPRMSA